MSFAVQSSFPPRILIVRVGAMGDVLHALPAVAMLREAQPEAHIGWAIEPRWAPLLRAEGATVRDPVRMPLVDAVHLVEAKQWNQRPLSIGTARSIAALCREIRGGRYSIAIDLQGTLRSAVIARMSGAAHAVGSKTPREAAARLLYRTRVQVGAKHVVEQAAEIVRAALAGASSALDRGTLPPLSTATMASMLPRDEAAEAWWRERRSTLCADRPPLLLAATAGWGAKQWPPEKFAELAARLAARGHCVLLNTAPATIDKVTAEVLRHVQQQHAEAAPHVHALPASLRQLIAATRDMHAVIAGDTGPLHLAALLDQPTVGLFGPTDPARTGPRRNSICLRDPASKTDHRRHTATEAGLARIPVDEVMAALEAVTRQASTTDAT